jgi:NADH-quinone oxidoreductase subunit N
MWSPDVYEGSPMSSTVFFEVIPKLDLFSVFLRFFTVMGPNFSNFLLSLLVFFSLFSAVVGSFGALKQKKLKRLLAYSSVSHVGYLLLAMSSCSFEGNQALFLYLIIYMVASVTIWSCVFSVDTVGNRFRAKTLADFAGVASLNPLLALTGMLSFFSLAGVPPLAGFLAKLSIFHAAICSSIILASVLSILTSVVASFYYIRLVKNLYFEPSRVVSSLRYSHKGVESLPLSVSRECSVVLGVGFFSLVILFAYPTPLFLLSQKMALCLF